MKTQCVIMLIVFFRVCRPLSLHPLRMSIGVTVYSTPGCPHCVRAKQLLTRLKVPYDEIDVSNAVERSKLASRAGRTSVPQIFAGDRHLGGADDLYEAFHTGKLAQVLDVDLVEEKVSRVTKKGRDVRSLHVPGRPLNVLRKETKGTIRAEELQRSALDLVDAHVTDSGVDYEALRYSSLMENFIQEASKLKGLDGAELSDAAFVNIYNALVMHASVVLGHPGTPEERSAFFDGSSGGTYDIGGVEYSLDDIEHGVLRRGRDWRGRDSPVRDLFKDRPFDNRIHFALNCGATSCPPVKLFREASYAEDLAAAARSFIESETSFRREMDSPYVTPSFRLDLSRLFLWYAGDFVVPHSEAESFFKSLSKDATGAPDYENLVKDFARDLLRTIATLLDDDVWGPSKLLSDIHAFFDLDAEQNALLSVSFSDYDWAPNISS